jgi:hypothetical protein
MFDRHICRKGAKSAKLRAEVFTTKARRLRSSKYLWSETFVSFVPSW